jgi:hypothetical protein
MADGTNDDANSLIPVVLELMISGRLTVVPVPE